MDHPATQADKLERLRRLGIDASHVRFVAADFTADPVAAALRDVGLETQEPALFLFEGIAAGDVGELTAAPPRRRDHRFRPAPGRLRRDQPGGRARWHYVTFDPEPTRGKQPADSTLIRLTAQGRIARDGWAPLGGVVEHRWRDRFGAQAIAELRAALTTITAHLDPSLPDCLPILAHGLFSRVPVGEARDPTAAPGRSQSPQPQTPHEPLWALLSRPLLAFAIEYESESPLSLAISANALRVLNADGVQIRDIPGLAGVSKEAVAMSMGILEKQALATEGPDPGGARWGVARLTQSGHQAQVAHADRVATIEHDWHARFRGNAIPALRAALASLPGQDLLAGLTPNPDGWRAQAKPPATLPRYPMVLHRGGYPDGS